MYRLGRYAAALCVGASLIALSGYALRADGAQAPTTTWTPGGPFGHPRQNFLQPVVVGMVQMVGLCGGEQDAVDARPEHGGQPRAAVTS